MFDGAGTAPDRAIILGCDTNINCGVGVPTPRVDAQGNPVLDQNGNPIIDLVPAPGATLQQDIDVAIIPPRPSGEPYYIRATMWTASTAQCTGMRRGRSASRSSGAGRRSRAGRPDRQREQVSRL